jgi:flotillin
MSVFLIMPVIMIFMMVMMMGVMAMGYVKVPPNKALVVFGRRFQGGGDIQILTGGGRFIMPTIESSEWLDLSMTTLNIVVMDILTRDLKLVNLECVAQTQIDPSESALKIAAVMLLKKTSDEVEYIAQKTLEGAVRGGCSTLRVSEIHADLTKLGEQMRVTAANDLVKMGINVVSFIVRDVQMSESNPEGAANALQVNLLSERVEMLEKEVSDLKNELSIASEKAEGVKLDRRERNSETVEKSEEPPAPDPADEPTIPPLDTGDER